MNISGIRPSDGFYDNNIKKLGAEMASPIVDNKPSELENLPESNIDKDTAASLTISNIGKAAAKNIEKAVINMEKDTAIHRYQYLIQDKPEVSTDEDRGLENFTL